MLHGSIAYKNAYKKCFFSYKVNNRGFTLIEVVVVSSILIFLMSSIWLSGSLRESDFVVMINQEKLRLLITRAKSMTLSGIVPSGGDTCGHGVRIERNRAFIFLDKGQCNIGNNQTYDVGEEVLGVVNDLVLRDGVFFQSSLGDITDIVFIPPDPQTIINADDTITEASILIMTSLGFHRGVLINKQGLIELFN